MTRSQAIKVMAGVVASFFGGAFKAYPQHANGFVLGGLFRLSLGKEKPPAPLEKCLTDLPDGVVQGGPCIAPDGSTHRGDVYDPSPALIPNTATASMNIGGFESFTFTNGSESITFTSKEIWEALKS